MCIYNTPGIDFTALSSCLGLVSGLGFRNLAGNHNVSLFALLIPVNVAMSLRVVADDLLCLINFLVAHNLLNLGNLDLALSPLLDDLRLFHDLLNNLNLRYEFVAVLDLWNLNDLLDELYIRDLNNLFNNLGNFAGHLNYTFLDDRLGDNAFNGLDNWNFHRLRNGINGLTNMQQSRNR
ncbi:hypothetical protein BOVATA_029910 [Babesia ovata]|uniref:Uncharacterized protein n=1 Tax=Babesia ovata TaxID=189622 RepID=A0A2H6KES2_9APIC|nr:uncharacterized protein BOVATA_029910 [Babesia ovata]GBE61498.1 hypothetical protein BOVATA_029910 [Babesia ovata]